MIRQNIINKFKLINNNESKKVLKKDILRKLKEMLTTKNILAKKKNCANAFNSQQASIFDIVVVLLNLVIFSLIIPNQIDKNLTTRIFSATLIIFGFITNRVIIVISESLIDLFSFSFIQGCWNLIDILELNFYSYLIPYIVIALFYITEIRGFIKNSSKNNILKSNNKN